MTSKGEAQETSEFLRRRQLRLQQVREQSKDIAKKIRQRAKVEKLRQVTELDDKKQRDYKHSQEKFVRKLEELYSRGLNNVGSGHDQARGLTSPVESLEKTDLSHVRGREAAAEIKRQKQQKLDKLKKLLDRKIQAREAANILSREKSSSASNKLATKPPSNSKEKNAHEATKSIPGNIIEAQDLNDKTSPEKVCKIDMGTQWDIDLLPPEWEPNVPALSIAEDDDTNQPVIDKNNSADKQKKVNMFALSDEMPSSLRGGVVNLCDTAPTKLSSTLVSEYIQNRVLRLREPEVTSNKQHSEDLQNLRQTIIRSRPVRPEGSVFTNICHVIEGEVFPVPTWHPETGCQCQSPANLCHHKQSLERKHYSNVNNSNKVFGSVYPIKHNLVSSPVSEMARPFIPHKCFGHNELSVPVNNERVVRAKASDNSLTKKKSVTMYSHVTRDSREVGLGEERMVQRERGSARDAYSRAAALAEPAPAPAPAPASSLHTSNKVAVTRQNVEKEYKDTIAFLNSLPKNKNSRAINNAFKDDHRIQAQKESRQRILQQEFKNIEGQNRRQDAQSSQFKSRFPERRSPERAKSPSHVDSLNERDFRYSWMPVPESDSRLAVHAIGGSGGGGQRSRADCYHEYRSRHKHTPPTRDVGTHGAKRKLQTVIFQDADDSVSAESARSDTGSSDSRVSDSRPSDTRRDSPQTRELTDNERIIIYKILNHKQRKNNKASKVNRADDVAEINAGLKDGVREKITKSCSKKTVGKVPEHKEHAVAKNEDPISADNLDEGAYEVAGNNRDNPESLHNAELENNQSNETVNKSDKLIQDPCSRGNEAGDGLQSRKKRSSSKCKRHSVKSQSATETAPKTSDQPAASGRNDFLQPAGLLKLMDEQEKQENNFYIGAAGFLKHDAYEVIIQLRKNDTASAKDVATDRKSSDTTNENTTNTKIEGFRPLESNEEKPVKQSGNSNHSELTAQPGSGTDRDSVNAANVPATNSTEGCEEQCVRNAINHDLQPTKTSHDRSVSTSVKDFGSTDVPMTELSSKFDPVPRAVASACTQTTPSPSNPRPVYIHMSSSTSTAYMSPPDVVLPNFFKRGDKQCRKARRSCRNVKNLEERNLPQEHHCKKYSSYKIFEKVTEPNIDKLNLYADIYREKKESTLSSSASHRNTMYPKYKKRGGSVVCCNQHARKVKRHLNTDKLDIPTRNTKNAAVHNKKSKNNSHFGTLSSRSYLSPMIKEYIHKLLSLNQEGIKTIQIINQDCSSVNTPASSVINVSTNIRNKNYRRRDLDIPSHDISLEQLKSVLKQNIYLHNETTLTKFTRPESTIKNQNKPTRNMKSRKRYTKSKKLHKVKSLNISKKIAVKHSEVSTDGHTCDNRRTHLSGNATSQVSPPSDYIENCGVLGAQMSTLKTSTSKEFNKRNINQCVDHDCSLAEPKAITSSENHSSNSNYETPSQPINISTQTSRNADGEINFIKLAEDKLQNMEKIADLTEKCTKRLSNLAKVLEEVRKNKSMAYGQVSPAESTSDSDLKLDKAVAVENEDLKSPSPTISVKNSQIECNVDSTSCEYLIPNVSKPRTADFSEIHPPENISSENSNTEYISKSVSSVSTSDENRATNTRCRNKPPPALLRIHLKRPQDNVVPHELSTVIEVDSPLSVKFKQQPSTINANQSNICTDSKVTRQLSPEYALSIDDRLSNDKIKIMSGVSSDDAQLQMMDLNQFNEIMLKPFVSLQEYARDHYGNNLDIKRESTSKDIGLTEEISSLHSDGSLPDVVAELLKRKLITEPFRFDTASNVNSTTISSESTLSILALSKICKERSTSKSAANKENVSETSDSLSTSSNPDLENAFKKLGMGWASSTLKKTKERLALSSSSNTSSSSLSRIKFKSATKQDEVLNDGSWTVPCLSKKPASKRRLETSKNVEQQTSFSNNMTVKEFLTKELAKKITFTDKSNRNDSNQEFVSLFETKLPEELKTSSQTVLEDNSGNSAPSGNNNRARTSTPVKLFKSMTYRSSSSSNMSNGLFSNADDLSSVKLTSASLRCPSASEKDDLAIPNCSLKMRKALSDCSKTDSC